MERNEYFELTHFEIKNRNKAQKEAKYRNFIVWAFCPGYGYLPMSNVDAVRANKPYFFNGKECENGHFAPRRPTDNNCIICCPVEDKTRLRYYKIWAGRVAKEKERELTSSQT